MTRRGLLTASAIVVATALSLGLIPMQTNALVALGIWAASVLVATVGASALAAALDRHDQRAEFSDVLREARRALR